MPGRIALFPPFCALVQLFFALALAQAQTDRPKIALVLGGGGARGAAHVGVLKVLEEQRVPIDFIVGTSMGAIVGGGYASGMSPDEIEETLQAIDWGDLFDERAPRQELSFHHKMDERRFTGLDVGFRNGRLSLPRGAKAGRKLEFLLKSVFLPTAGIRSFDELPVPFRAVATDIETGNPMIVAHGNLAMAIRASMSIPGAFSPVEIEGHLVDGYVSNNVPVDIAKAVSPDFIIAVDVGTPLARREDLGGLIDILNQVGGIATAKNVQERLSLLSSKDILIRPNLEGFSVTDFERLRDIIPRGADAAGEKIAALQQLSVSPERYRELLDSQRAKPRPIPIIHFIRVVPTDRVIEKRIRSRIKLVPGEPLDLETLRRDLDRIHAIGEFESVSYSIVTEEGRTGLLIEPREKLYGPHYLRLGFNLVNDFEGDSYYNVLLDYTRTSLNDLGAEWRSELQVGRTSRLFTELYQPLDYAERFFVAPHVEVRQDLRDIYEDGSRIAEYRKRGYGGGSDVGMHIGRIAETRAGLWWGNVDAEPSTGDADLPEFDLSRAGARLRLTVDSVDDPNFPRRGVYARADGWFEREGLGADDSYEKVEGIFILPVSAGPHTVSPRIRAGVSPDDDLPFYDEFTLGGPGSLSGYRTDELRGKDVLLGQVLYYYELGRRLFSFASRSYLGFSLDWGNTWTDNDDMKLDDLIFGGSVFAAVDTALGPLYFGFGMNEEAKQGEVFFSFGQRL